jgi:hypothetical protein
MSVSMPPPWVAFSQTEWQERADALAQPLWLKVSCLAYANVQANGHATFNRGVLARSTGKSRQDIDRAIRTAIEYGWLHPASCSECLVPPGNFVEMGFGSKRKVCPIHTVSKNENVEPSKKIMRSADENSQVEGSPSTMSASHVGAQ